MESGWHQTRTQGILEKRWLRFGHAESEVHVNMSSGSMSLEPSKACRWMTLHSREMATTRWERTQSQRTSRQRPGLSLRGRRTLPSLLPDLDQSFPDQPSVSHLWEEWLRHILLTHTPGFLGLTTRIVSSQNSTVWIHFLGFLLRYFAPLRTRSLIGLLPHLFLFFSSAFVAERSTMSLQEIMPSYEHIWSYSAQPHFMFIEQRELRKDWMGQIQEELLDCQGDRSRLDHELLEGIGWTCSP